MFPVENGAAGVATKADVHCGIERWVETTSIKGGARIRSPAQVELFVAVFAVFCPPLWAEVASFAGFTAINSLPSD